MHQPQHTFVPSQETALANGNVFIAESNPNITLGSIIATVGFGTAAAVSYKRNESVVWAGLSGLVWPAYLIYALVIDKE